MNTPPPVPLRWNGPQWLACLQWSIVVAMEAHDPDTARLLTELHAWLYDQRQALPRLDPAGLRPWDGSGVDHAASN